MTVRIAAIGEAIEELSRTREATELACVGYAGDTFNTTVYIMRQGGVAVDFVPWVGADDFSADLVEFATPEGVGTGLDNGAG